MQLLGFAGYFYTFCACSRPRSGAARAGNGCSPSFRLPLHQCRSCECPQSREIHNLMAPWYVYDILFGVYSLISFFCDKDSYYFFASIRFYRQNPAHSHTAKLPGRPADFRSCAQAIVRIPSFNCRSQFDTNDRSSVILQIVRLQYKMYRHATFRPPFGFRFLPPSGYSLYSANNCQNKAIPPLNRRFIADCPFLPTSYRARTPECPLYHCIAVTRNQYRYRRGRIVL